jgi:hypothetical protein
MALPFLLLWGRRQAATPTEDNVQADVVIRAYADARRVVPAAERSTFVAAPDPEDIEI